MSATPIHTHRDTIDIAAPPAAVWALVTSMERYGEWSGENQGGRWRKNEDGVDGTGKVGEIFVGVNRLGEREWKAMVEVVEREENRAFAFVTGGLAANYAQWRYVLEPIATGTRLAEEYELRTLTPAMVENGQSEIDKRMDLVRTSVKSTLEGIKRTAEAG